MLPHIHTDNFSKVLHQYSTVELENMVQQYPYFHQAHLLLAKKYQDEKNSKFDEQLQLAVLYAQDRELLYHIFSNQETSTWPSEPDWNIAVSLHEESRTEEAEERVNTEEIEEEIYTEEAEEKVFTEEVEEKIFTEAEIAVSDDIPAEAVEQHPIILVPDEESPEIQIQVEEEIFATGEPHTFEEWLKAFSETDISVEEIKSEQEDLQETEEEELDQIIQQGGASDYLHKLVEEETHYSKGLEEYIKEQVQKRKKPERVALLNENEIDPDIVTETMAKVYEMQKKYSRAIRAYEMLILKYPEKSDLFAARINYLKNIF